MKESVRESGTQEPGSRMEQVRTVSRGSAGALGSEKRERNATTVSVVRGSAGVLLDSVVQWG